MTIDLYQILKQREREGYPAHGLTTAAWLEVVCIGQSFIDSMYIKPEMEFHTQMMPVFCPSSETKRSISTFTLCLFPFVISLTRSFSLTPSVCPFPSISLLLSCLRFGSKNILLWNQQAITVWFMFQDIHYMH